jgi:hypothetical protein
MFEYVRWCSSVEEAAKGICKQCVSKILEYSVKNLLSIDNFTLVNLQLFKIIHFLTVLPIIFIRLVIFNLVYFQQKINNFEVL